MTNKTYETWGEGRFLGTVQATSDGEARRFAFERYGHGLISVAAPLSEPKYRVAKCADGGWGIWKFVNSCVPDDWMLYSWYRTKKEATAVLANCKTKG